MESTKTAIFEAFQQILEETPINKITVKSIVERCGINRNTFYYHFDGIPELIEFGLTTLADQLTDGSDQSDPSGDLLRTARYLAQHRRSILHIYRYLPREEFLRFLNKITVYVVEKRFRRITSGMDIPEEELAALIRFYKSSMVGLLLDWLDDGMNYDFETMVIRLCRLMDDSVRPSIEKKPDA